MERNKYYVLVDEEVPIKGKKKRIKKKEDDEILLDNKKIEKMSREERKEFLLLSAYQDYLDSDNISERARIVRNIIDIEGFTKDSTVGGEATSATHSILKDLEKKLKQRRKKSNS